MEVTTAAKVIMGVNVQELPDGQQLAVPVACGKTGDLATQSELWGTAMALD